MNTGNQEREKLQFVNIAKFLLILGVVIIHSNLFEWESVNISETNKAAKNIVEFISGSLCKASVPCFFMLSGFLYFYNLKKFSVHVYVSKLKRRFFTLIVPYLLWNLFGCILQFFKARYLGFPAYGFIEDGVIVPSRVIESFWDMHNGYPAAFAFWFIRNLIVFVILSPLAYVLSKNRIIFIITLCASVITDFNGYYFIYFIIGCRGALQHGNIIRSIEKSTMCIGGLIWILCALVYFNFQSELLYATGILILESMGAFVFIIGISKMMTATEDRNRLFQLLVSSTLFIYAFHQFFCSIFRKIFIQIFGLETFSGTILAFFCNILTLVGISFVVWLIMRKLCPRWLGILTGNRT